MRTIPQVHILGQYSYHEPAEIVADMAGLVALGDAISQATIRGEAEVVLFPTDGEGFTLRVRLLDTKDEAWKDVPMPYAAPAIWEAEGKYLDLRTAVLHHRAAVESGLLGKAEQDAADRALWAAADLPQYRK